MRRLHEKRASEGFVGFLIAVPQHTLNIGEQLHFESRIYIIKSDSSNCDIISEG
jgi:hypothetical protein